MEKPLVSVLMGVQNLERFVGEAIESVLAQTYENFEFIILDDGSTDKTPEIIAEYAKRDKRIQPYYFKEKQGISIGCNFTIEKAIGKYIARIDGDDCWHFNKLEKQIFYLEEHPECGACFTWVKIIDENGYELTSAESENRGEIFNSKNRSRAEWIRTLFYEGCRMAHPSSVIRKDVFSLTGMYNVSYRQLLDYDLWIRILKITQIHMLEEILMNYRWSGKNVSSSSDDVMFRTYFEMLLILKQYFKGMTNEFFIEAFSAFFKKKLASSELELMCEKAFLLLDYRFYHDIGKIAALEILSELVNNKEAYRVLRDQYDFDVFSFHRIQSEPVFYYSSLEKWPLPFSEHVSFFENKLKVLENENNTLNEKLVESEKRVAYFSSELMLAQQYIKDTTPELEYFRKSMIYRLYKRSTKKKSED